MRKVKSTALLGAFVAVASLGAISHEAHGSTLTSTANTIAKEALPASVTLPAPVLTASVNYTSSATLTLTLSGGAAFLGSYTIGNGAGCSATASAPSGTLSFSNCSITASASYPIENVSATTFSVTAPSQGISLISLSYSSNVYNDAPSSVTLAQVQQQLTIPSSPSTAYINPASLSTFLLTSYSSPYNYVAPSDNIAYTTMMVSSSTGFSISISSDTINVVFNGIPSSVVGVDAVFPPTYSSNTGSVANSDTASTAVYTPGTGSVTVSLTLPSNGAVFSQSSLLHEDLTTIYFSNSGNIQPGTIYISSILGAAGLYQYLPSGSQNFLTFAIGGTQIYVPDALAPFDGNVINSGYITISMPSSTDIASITVLNNPSASCPVPTLSNGALQSTSSTGVYYIDLSKLAPLCTGLSASAWQSGVPLVMTISGSNVGPNTVTADAYAVFNGYLKRIPVNVVAGNSVNTQFSY
jgi:hypothetical protein